MFNHIMVGSNDIERSKRFYDAVLATLGAKRLMNIEDRASLWGGDAPQFMVTKPANGQPATAANGGTVGLAASSRDAVPTIRGSVRANKR